MKPKLFKTLLSALALIIIHGLNAERPNIVLIVTDDQNIESYGSYGGDVYTPAMDQLAATGARFTNAYAVSSVCSPSRYNILTGRYAGRCPHPRFNIVSPEGEIARISNKSIGLVAEETSLVQALADAGYRTGIVGKWHLGKWMAGWKDNGEWRFPPGFYEMGLQEYPSNAPLDDPELSQALAHNQKIYAEELKQYGWDYASSIYWCNPRELHHDKLYNHNQEWLTAGALEFIDSSKDQPFFLYLATTLAHSPPPQHTLDRGDESRATGGGWKEEHLSSQTSRDTLAKRVEAAGVPAETAYLTWLDDSVASIIKRLEENGLRENTLIILTSDHGLEGKATLYESGIHVPLILNWPGRVHEGKRPEIVQHIDLKPTILELLGIEPALGVMDGTSFAPALQSEKPITDQGRSVYFEYGYARAVRMGPWKYIAVRYPEGTRESFENGELEKLPYLGHNRTLGRWQAPRFPNYFLADQLYNIERDPSESVNLAAEPEHAATLSAMKEELKRHLKYAPSRPYGEFAK